MFRPHWVCPVQWCLCFPSLNCSGSQLLYMERALCRVQFQFSGPPQKCGFRCACVLCLPRLSGSGSQRLGRTFPGCGTSFPPWPQRARRSGLRKSLDRNRGPVFRVRGGGFSGAEFAPFPYPLPPASSGDGPALLWSFSVLLFCELPAVYSGRSIFISLAHSLKKYPSDCSQGLLAGPYPKQCCPLLSVSPPLAGGGCGRLGYFSAGSCF